MPRLKTALAVAFPIVAIGFAVFSFTARAPLKTLLQVSKAPPVKLTSPTEGKTLALYDQGGRFGCGIVTESEYPGCLDSIARARMFLWQHWDQKRRGYAIVRFGTVDAVSDSHIFIEPDESGAWHVVWRIDRVVSVEHSGDIDVVLDISSIERGQASRSFDPVEPGTPILIFRDKAGKEIRRL